jgi:gamma-glutamylcyclotransferase
MTRSTFYFAYGSNFWLQQMSYRCPGSTYLGIGVLRDWKWLISASGYANIIESQGDIVYGFVYTITSSDEDRLDGYEGVPECYIKQTLSVMMMGHGEGKRVDAMVYLDTIVGEAKPKTEYIGRMNSAIEDAVDKGIPKGYIEKYLRPFIPEE